MTLSTLIHTLRDNRRLRLAMERDRRILATMEDRLLDDIGLDREELDALLAGGLLALPQPSRDPMGAPAGSPEAA